MSLPHPLLPSSVPPHPSPLPPSAGPAIAGQAAEEAASLPGVLHPQAAPPLAKGGPAGLKGSSVLGQVGVPRGLGGPHRKRRRGGPPPCSCLKGYRPGAAGGPLHHEALAAPPAAAAPSWAPRRAACAPDMLLPDAGPEPGDQPGLPDAAGHRALGAVCDIPAQAVLGHPQLLRAGQAAGLRGLAPVSAPGPGGRPEGESAETLHHHELLLQEGPGVPVQ